MMFGELYTKEEMREMIDNTKGFYDYCKFQEQLKREEDAYGAFSWLFNPNFTPLPLNPENMGVLTESEMWFIERAIIKTIKREWNTPAEFKDREYKFRV